jgi:hypothetical protein
MANPPFSERFQMGTFSKIPINGGFLRAYNLLEAASTFPSQAQALFNGAIAKYAEST